MVTDNRDLKSLVIKIASGQVDVKEAVASLEPLLEETGTQKTNNTATSNLDLDLDRAARCGFPEAVFGEGKTVDVVVAAFEQQIRARQNCLATRINPVQWKELSPHFPEAEYNAAARTVRIMCDDSIRKSAPLFVLTAGSTDQAVAEEAVETLRWMGFDPELICDVGVAGPHRLLQHVDRLQQACAIVVVAGMEGALPSVVGGWVSCPVIAVPTSVGYGASFQGLTALLGMLNSCTANVCTVNIDAGFKGGYLAGLMAAQTVRRNNND